MGRIFNFLNIVMLIWIGTFIYLILDDNYTLFIKPEFGFLIYAGLFICSAFFISGMLNRPGRLKTSDIMNGLIILMPVVFIFLSGSQTLNSYALTKRTLMSPNLDSIENKSVLDEADSQKAGEPIKVTLSQLLRNWPSYSGKQISIQGLLHQSLEDNDDYSLVFKYLISCCAADAIPVGIFIDKERTIGFSDDDWVKVTGVVSLDKMDGNNVVIMSLDSIEKVEKPSKNAAYLFF
ncbi:TIGR03943 family putative permease subunit [Desulfobacula sp.]|uniref:TIGR03943 family putative permease subunit n=1 Tax=Desulfobacula sp. TaxID=2593537 RepID=UPI001ED49BA7|nr:TIGR03943 family protein [Desulfobacula sp.]